jgi:hypothetical protein
MIGYHMLVELGAQHRNELLAEAEQRRLARIAARPGRSMRRRRTARQVSIPAPRQPLESRTDQRFSSAGNASSASKVPLAKVWDRLRPDADSRRFS